MYGTAQSVRLAPGLGAAASVYPWREYSDSTLSLQIATNFELQQLDMPLLGEDGILGAQTCGAQLWLADRGYEEHANALEVADCQSFGYPPSAAPPTTTPPPVPDATTPRATEMPRYRAGMGSAGWLLIAGGVAAAGIYLATRSKRR